MGSYSVSNSVFCLNSNLSNDIPTSLYLCFSSNPKTTIPVYGVSYSVSVYTFFSHPITSLNNDIITSSLATYPTLSPSLLLFKSQSNSIVTYALWYLILLLHCLHFCLNSSETQLPFMGGYTPSLLFVKILSLAWTMTY